MVPQPYIMNHLLGELHTMYSKVKTKVYALPGWARKYRCLKEHSASAFMKPEGQAG